MLAVLNFLPYPADLSIGHLRCFVQSANDKGTSVEPSTTWLSAVHRDALLGLADGDARKRALLACTLVDMGEPTATGAFALDKQAALKAAIAPRRTITDAEHLAHRAEAV